LFYRPALKIWTITVKQPLWYQKKNGMTRMNMIPAEISSAFFGWASITKRADSFGHTKGRDPKIPPLSGKDEKNAAFI
jgi:hypothetical protein